MERQEVDIEFLSKLDRIIRMQLIDSFTVNYALTDALENIAAASFEFMANAILHEELSDKRVDKMSIEEYPVMSATQLHRRNIGRIPAEALRHVDTSGKEHKEGRPRKISRSQAIRRDEALARNRERKRKYRAFAKDSEVITYHIDGKTDAG